MFDHMVNHRPATPLALYKRIQYILNTSKDFYYDTKNERFALTENFRTDSKGKPKKNILLFLKEGGRIVLYKTFYDTSKNLPGKFKKINLAEKQGLNSGADSLTAISQSEKDSDSAFRLNIQGRPDNSSIQQTESFSTQKGNNRVRLVIKKSVAEDLENILGKSHKYISRWFKDGKWEYKYPSDQPCNNNHKNAFREIARNTRIITDIDLLPETSTEEDIKHELGKVKELAVNGKLICPALGNSKICINKKSFKHIFFANGKKRTPEKIREKSKYIRFIPSILKYGKLSEKSYKNKRIVYGVVCRANINGKIQAIEIAVCYDREQKKCYLSIADEEIKKALESSAFFTARSMFPDETAVSHADINIPQPEKKGKQKMRLVIKIQKSYTDFIRSIDKSFNWENMRRLGII